MAEAPAEAKDAEGAIRRPESPMSVLPPPWKKAELDGQPAAPPLPLTLQSRLHSFSFPTRGWARQRILRCSKLPQGIGADATRSPPVASGKKRPPSSSADGEAATAAAALAERPWNLRSKRSACVAPRSPGKIGGSQKPCDLAPAEDKDAVGFEGAEKKERPKFSISLTREEIEADFLALANKRPPRRPKKRPRIKKRQLDVFFPGAGLTEITSDMYKND